MKQKPEPRKSWNSPEIHCYMEGWAAGAAMLPINQSAEFQEIYDRGWKDGKRARHVAVDAECNRFGVNPPGVVELQ
jgi:hypothetical protein